MLLYKILIFLSVLVVVSACNAPNSKFEEVDLMSYGMPIKISGPNTTLIKVDDLGIMKDVTIVDTLNDGFNLQIFSSKTDILDKAKMISEAKSEIEATEFYSKTIMEDEDGFIYEKKISDDYINFDFRVFRLQGDVAYTFQAGFGEQYDLDQIKQMFQAVK